MTRKTNFTRIAAGLAVAVLPFTAACGDDEVVTPAAPAPLPGTTAPAVPPGAPATNASPSSPSSPSGATSPSTGASVGEARAEGGLGQEALRGRVGQNVTVTGEVPEILGPNAFTLGGEDIGENPVLVVSASKPNVQEGDKLRVQAKVIRFSVPGVEQDLDLDFVDNEFAEFDGDPALQASMVQRAAAAGVGDGGQGGAAQESLDGRIGQTVDLRGEVATIVGPNAFTVGGDAIGENPILVVSAMNPDVQAGDTVRIRGKVIRFSVPGVERDFDLDLVDNEFEDFDGDPAVQAASVTKAQR